MSKARAISPEELRECLRTGDWSCVDDGHRASARRIEFVVPGVPVPKGRPRFGKDGRAHTPKRTRDFEAKVATTFKLLHPHHRPWTGEVRMSVTAYGAHHAADASNILKAVEDALNGVAYKDDVQVARTVAEKHPAGASGPRTIVVLRHIGAGEGGDPAAGLREQWGERADG